jgi:translocation and assembly module TamB
VRVRGPLAALVPSGDLQVQQAQVQILPLRLALSDINVRAQVAPGGVRVHQLALRSGNGHLTGSGTLSLQRYAITALDFTFATHRLRVINTRQYTAAVSGQLICSGAPQTPFIRGALTVEDVTLRPNLSLLQRGPVTADPTIIVVQNAQELAARTQHAKQQQAEETGLPVPPERTLYQQLGLDLRVTVPRDTWVHVDAGSIELMGQIHVRKDPAADLTLAGSIEAVRGWYAFQGRKFEVEKGQLLFTGGNEIDPGLDIVARYTLPQYTVDLVVGGVASAPTLTLRSDPALEQADILSLLLFGKPAGALNQGEKNTLQTQALQATAGYVAADLRRSVADRLGVDTLEFDMGDNWAQSRIGAGKYVTKDIFVSTSQKLGGKQERNLYNTNPFCW